MIALDIPTPAWAEPLLGPARYKGASGGRSSGKSHLFGELAVEAMLCDPSLRFVCIREVQRSLKFSAKSLVESKIRALGVEGEFEVRATEIRRVGGDGVMIFEGMQDHTADSIKSLEGFGRAWVEEAQSISERSLRLLLPTIRADASEIWFSWNPESPTDPVDAFFAGHPAGAVHVHTTYRDNPFCPAVMRTEAERLLAADPDAYEHIWGGGYFLGGHGRVYSSFSARPWPAGNVDESVTDTGAELLVGMDFNVNPMTCVVAVRRVDECHILDGLEIPSSNTEEVAVELKRRYPGRRIIVCPDPSGRARKSSAPVGQTDFTILQRAGFEVRAPSAAPLVVDRENNANTMFHDLATGRRRVRVHPRAKPYVTALSNLTYKEGTSQRDKKSGFDHICFEAGTAIRTVHGDVAIERIVPGDMVLTREGFFPVAACGMTSPLAEVWRTEMNNGQVVVSTPDHPFWVDGKGFVPLRCLTPQDILCACENINASGSRPTAARYHRVTTSTTKTRIGKTTRWTTSNVSRATNIFPIIGKKIASADWRASVKHWMPPGRRQRHGIVPPKAENGIGCTRGSNGAPTSLLSARGAVDPSLFWRAAAVYATFAQRLVRPLNDTRRAWTTNSGRVLSAAGRSLSTDTGEPPVARTGALRIVASAPRGAAAVFNVTVDGPHEYFANGVLVSNCDAGDYLLWQEFNVLTQPPTVGFTALRA